MRPDRRVARFGAVDERNNIPARDQHLAAVLVALERVVVALEGSSTVGTWMRLSFV